MDLKFQSMYSKPEPILPFGLPGGSDSEESACRSGDPGSTPVGKIPWRRAWQPTPVFLPGEFREKRSLADYSHGVSNSPTELSD